MAKTDNTPAPENATPVVELNLGLTEFCSRLSMRVTQPELIAAFYHTERAAGRLSDTDAAFSARFDAFATSPV